MLAPAKDRNALFLKILESSPSKQHTKAMKQLFSSLALATETIAKNYARGNIGNSGGHSTSHANSSSSRAMKVMVVYSTLENAPILLTCYI